jgi:hypothetical protein
MPASFFVTPRDPTIPLMSTHGSAPYKQPPTLSSAAAATRRPVG